MELSVVVATMDRPGSLRRALESFARQSLLPERFELVVVDNGTHQATEATVKEFSGRLAHCVFLREPRPGAAAARNTGIRAAGGATILFLDDDVVADPQLFERHLAAQRAGQHLAVLGSVRFPWSGSESPLKLAVTLHPELIQSFSFPDANNVPFRYFYTCNLSLPRAFFTSNNFFDESFTGSGFEDIELGYRFVNAGGRIIYLAEASALHDIELAFPRFSRKAYRNGWWLAHLLRLHPELAPQLAPRTSLPKLFLGRLSAPLAPLFDQHLATPWLARLCWLSLQARFWKGFKDYSRAGTKR